MGRTRFVTLILTEEELNLMARLANLHTSDYPVLQDLRKKIRGGIVGLATDPKRAHVRPSLEEVEPTCDICGEGQECLDGRPDCHLEAGNWNGDTGNHFSCEEAQP